MTRLSIELTEHQHQQIKAVAALQGKSIKAYALERLVPMNQDEEKAMSELQTLLNQRIDGVRRDELSSKSIDTIFDEVWHEGNGDKE